MIGFGVGFLSIDSQSTQKEYLHAASIHQGLLLSLLLSDHFPVQVERQKALKFVCKTAAHALVALCYEDCLEALEKAVQFVSSTSEIHAVSRVSGPQGYPGL